MRNPNGFGSVIKLSGKRRKPFAVRVTTGWTNEGKQKYKYLSYHEKKTEAMLALAEFNKNPYDIDASRITFAEIYERWSEREYESLSYSSVKGYKSAYKKCSTLDDKVFKELRKNHLQGVIDEITAPSMAEVTKFLFMKLYKYALENDIVEKDYSKFVKLPKKAVADEKIPFTKDEVNYLWDNIDNIKYADLTLILLYTGMRIGELLDMKKHNVVLAERYMIGGSKTKAGKDRIIPIHKRIVPLIQKRMEDSHLDCLFLNKRGSKLSYSTFMKSYWDNIVAKFKDEHTPHDTRHTFISEMDRLGVNTILTQRIVGHSNVNVTQHYTHKTIEELIEAVDNLE